jgi:hypothetical protein
MISPWEARGSAMRFRKRVPAYERHTKPIEHLTIVGEMLPPRTHDL